MPKKSSIVKRFSRKALVSLFLSFTPLIAALADNEAQLPPPTPLSDYVATPTPKPTWTDEVKLPFPQHLYVKAQAGFQSTNAGTISNSSSTPTPVFVGGQTLSENSVTGNFALGYQFHKTGLLTRAEVAYMLPQTLNLNITPAFNGEGLTSNFNSSLKTQSLLFKLYNDFVIGNLPLIPYVEGGIGAAFNQSSVNSNINIDVDAGPAVFIIPTQASTSQSDDNFAWDLGAGARYRFGNTNLYLDLGYEYQQLGNAVKWNLNYTQPGFGSLFQVNLQTQKIYNNVILAGLFWQPFAQSDADSDNATLSNYYDE